jgi:hypothetical protein
MSFDLGAVPYPLITPFNDDFDSASLVCAIEQDGFDPDTVTAEFSYQFLSSEIPELKYLEDLCAQGLAERVLFFESPDSLHRSSLRIGKKGSVHIGHGEIYGRVTITPFIIATQALEHYDPPSRHAEWGEGNFAVAANELLAIGESVRVEISHKIARKQAMIELVESEEMEPEVYRIDASDDVIVVNAGKDIRKVFEIMKRDSSKKPLLFMSLLKDVLQQGLLQARESGGEQKWVRSLEKELGVEDLSELSEDEVWDAPLRLLYPHGAKKILADAEES